MDHFETAVADLIAAAGPDKDSVEEAYACAQRLLAELETAEPAACQRALGGLADVLPAAPLDCAGVVALACGAGGKRRRPGTAARCAARPAAGSPGRRRGFRRRLPRARPKRSHRRRKRRRSHRALRRGDRGNTASRNHRLERAGPVRHGRHRRPVAVARRSTAGASAAGFASARPSRGRSASACAVPRGNAARAGRRGHSRAAPGDGPRLAGAHRRRFRQFPAAHAAGGCAHRRSG